MVDMYSKPTETETEAAYLEPEEAALLLESARTYLAPVDDGGFAHMYPLLATFLLTGGRKSEVLGLEVDDVSLRLGKVYFRLNEWRGLKTKGSKRKVPLWPQLEQILRDYLLERERTGGLASLLATYTSICFGTPTRRPGFRRWTVASPSRYTPLPESSATDLPT